MAAFHEKIIILFEIEIKIIVGRLEKIPNYFCETALKLMLFSLKLLKSWIVFKAQIQISYLGISAN